MAGATYTTTVELTEIHCGQCGATYAINEKFRAQCYEKGSGWHCPYCQSGWGYFTNNRHKKLKDELERTKRDRDHHSTQASHAKRQRDSARKSYKKIRNRVKNGVCPCCNRTFQNLLEHMRTEHPDVGDDKTLRQLRENYGLTQIQLANEIGVSNVNISNFECGRSVAVWARDQIEAWIDEQGHPE